MLLVAMGPIASEEAPSAEAGPQRRSARLVAWLRGPSSPGDLRIAGLLAIGVVAARLVASLLLGSAFDSWPARIGWDMHLLDVVALRRDPAGSMLHLHSQPPLYSAVAGVASALPGWLATSLLYLGSLLLGSMAAAATYLLARELGVRRWLSAAAVVLGVVLAPAWLLWASIAFYPFPVACLVSTSALFALRFARDADLPSGAVLAVLLGLVVLTSSLYQWPWMLGVLALAGLLGRAGWRRTLLVSLVPLLVVGAWAVRGALLFGQASSSSWLGINLSKTAIAGIPKADRERLVAGGVLSPLALHPGFRPLPDYPAADRGQSGPTGVAVLDEAAKANGQANLNQAGYVEVSGRMLREDLKAIAARPGDYAADVGRAVAIWQSPSDANLLFTRKPVGAASPEARAYSAWLAVHAVASPAMLRYRDAYDAVVGLTPRASWLSVTLREGARTRPVSLTAVTSFALCLLGLPVVIWRRRRDRPLLAGLLVIWGTVAMMFLSSSLLELGENDRFRFMLGSLVLVGALVSLESALRWLARRREPGEIAGDGRPVGSQPPVEEGP